MNLKFDEDNKSNCQGNECGGGVESCDCQGLCSCEQDLEFEDEEDCSDCLEDCCGDEGCEEDDLEDDLKV